MMICRYIKGDKCAEQYCDFWSKYHKKCITAVKDKAFAEVCIAISEALLSDPTILGDLKDFEEMAERIKKFI